MDPVVEALKFYIGEHATYIIVILVAIIALACWLTARYVSMKNKLEKFEELPCSRNEEKLESHDKLLSRMEVQFDKFAALPCTHHNDKLENHERLLSRMEAQLEILVSNAIDKNTNKIRNRAGGEFSRKHSPRTLNEKGELLLKKCGGDIFLKEHGDFLIDKIKQLQPKTALDVEDYALAVLQINTKEDMFIPLKNWVYNEPTWTFKDSNGVEKQQDIELDDVLFVLSLPLRDRYLEKYHIPS